MAEIKKLGIDLQLEDQIAQGEYANLAIISHSSSEFVLDFAALMPGVPKAKIKSRIILAPEHAKRLLLTHFSNCIDDPEEYLPLAREIFPNTDAAQDGQCITLYYSN